MRIRIHSSAQFSSLFSPSSFPFLVSPLLFCIFPFNRSPFHFSPVHKYFLIPVFWIRIAELGVVSLRTLPQQNFAHSMFRVIASSFLLRVFFSRPLLRAL